MGQDSNLSPYQQRADALSVTPQTRGLLLTNNYGYHTNIIRAKNNYSLIVLSLDPCGDERITKYIFISSHPYSILLFLKVRLTQTMDPTILNSHAFHELKEKKFRPKYYIQVSGFGC